MNINAGFDKPHYNVSLVVSANHLPPGKMEIVGHKYEKGQMGERIVEYRYFVDNRDSYDKASDKAKQKYGNTAAAANALFYALDNRGK